MPKENYQIAHQNIARRLTRFMDALSMSCADLASAADVDSKTVERWKTGDQDIYAHDIGSICKKLGVPINMLLSGSADVPVVGTVREDEMVMILTFRTLSSEQQELFITKVERLAAKFDGRA